MKRIRDHQQAKGTKIQGTERTRNCAVIASAKEQVLREYRELVGEHVHVLRLALNEAEALAWDTGLPHLFFPVLAAEKAQTAVSWHRRQRSVQKPSEIAFAE